MKRNLPNSRESLPVERLEDPDDNDRDKDYQPRPNEESQSSQSEASASGSQVIRPRKKFRNVAERKRTKAKTLRNTGKQYQGKGGEVHAQRSVKDYIKHAVINVMTITLTKTGKSF
uniref:Uncharacterized protein n=1 Tax=Timema poppense TaxID=170557 RepID=A0A7R9DCV7_TIMPO|nr:unnamed protein product [Timema poppensis]